jgi:hypothetical protein
LLRRIPKLEPLGQTGDTWVAPKQPERKSVKRHNVQAGCRRQLQYAGDAAAHLVCGLLGKGHGQYASWVDALAGEVDEAPRQGAGLAGARARKR